MQSSKTLVLIRHAHRDTDHRERDNGLSEKGKEQVKKLVKFGLHRLEKLDSDELALFSSPKKRCVETITPLAKELGFSVKIDPRVDEHGLNETGEKYFARLSAFLEFWKYEGPAVTVVCSHGDWIPFAVQKLTRHVISIKKSGWCEIESGPTECEMTWLVQKHY